MSKVLQMCSIITQKKDLILYQLYYTTPQKAGPKVEALIPTYTTYILNITPV